MGLARRAQGARRRRCGDIVDDEQRGDRRAIPMRPLGSGFARASAALPLLDDVTASPASRRLASARAKPGTRPLLILGQAPSSRRKTPRHRVHREWRVGILCAFYEISVTWILVGTVRQKGRERRNFQPETLN